MEKFLQGWEVEKINGDERRQNYKKKWKSRLPKTDMLRMTSVALFERVLENAPSTMVKKKNKIRALVLFRAILHWDKFAS